MQIVIFRKDVEMFSFFGNWKNFLSHICGWASQGLYSRHSGCDFCVCCHCNGLSIVFGSFIGFLCRHNGDNGDNGDKDGEDGSAGKADEKADNANAAADAVDGEGGVKGRGEDENDNNDDNGEKDNAGGSDGADDNASDNNDDDDGGGGGDDADLSIGNCVDNGNGVDEITEATDDADDGFLVLLVGFRCLR